jgi:MFS family permease
MLKLPLVLLYTAMTFFAWGVYGILLNNGQKFTNGAFLKPFVGVGLAYFIIAVLGAGILLGGTKEKGHWSFMGTLLSFIAGAVGALGALGVILALAFGGEPVFVMPIIFGGAPVINTLFTSWLGKTFHKITPLFVIGMILVGCGMIGILRYKPHAKKAPTPTTEATVLEQDLTASRSLYVATLNTAIEETNKEITAAGAKEESSSHSPKAEKRSSPFVVFASIILAVICWGAYGPVLHLGQMKMGGSRLRPFCCVGLAYFFIAVALPLSLLPIDSPGSVWTWYGMLWSVAAGTAGAIGALGIILAFTYGGKPVFVMPLVFGFAPVVNTLVTLWLTNQLHTIDPIFYASLATVICGAVMVLIFAPKSSHGPPKPATAPSAAPSAPPEPAATKLESHSSTDNQVASERNGSVVGSASDSDRALEATNSSPSSSPSVASDVTTKPTSDSGASGSS